MLGAGLVIWCWFSEMKGQIQLRNRRNECSSGLLPVQATQGCSICSYFEILEKLFVDIECPARNETGPDSLCNICITFDVRGTGA